MDIRFLESLLAAVESGSIAGAARLQGLTAAAVSQRIKVLEADLGCLLLVRGAHSARPTAECSQMLPAAKELVQNAKRLPSYLQLDGLSGPYRLGFISTALLDFVPEIIREFKTRAPKVDLNIRPGPSENLYRDLTTGDLDGAITVLPPFNNSKDVRVSELVQQPFCHIRPTDERCPDQGQEALPWIVYDRTSWGGRIVSALIEKTTESQSILCELDALETIAAMVEQGLGQGIIPMWQGLRNQHPDLQIIPVSDASIDGRTIVFLDRYSAGVSQISKLVIDVLKSATQSEF